MIREYLAFWLGYLTTGIIVLLVAWVGGAWGLGIAVFLVAAFHLLYRWRKGYWYDELEDLGHYDERDRY